jgi:hypothetical protein
MIKTFDINNPLIKEFEEGRKLQENRGDYFSSNYSLDNFVFNDQTAFSIGYKNNKPYLFSTIFRRPSWPQGAYRILNRTWKTNRQTNISKAIDSIFLDMVDSQLDWLTKKSDFEVAIISREHNSINTLTNVRDLLNMRGHAFCLHSSRIWVCNGLANNCFQDILYTGKSEIISTWKLRD